MTTAERIRAGLKAGQKLSELSEEERAARMERFTAPLFGEVIADKRKTNLIFTLDAHGLPWSWEAQERLLEERLRRFDKQLYEQFLRENGTRAQADTRRAAGA